MFKMWEFPFTEKKRTCFKNNDTHRHRATSLFKFSLLWLLSYLIFDQNICLMGEVSLNVTAFVPYFSDFTFLQDLVIVCTCFTFNLCELGLVWCLYEYVTSNLCELAMLCMIILTWELLVLRSSACDKLRLAS